MTTVLLSFRRHNSLEGMETAYITLLAELQRLLPIPNALVAISKAMRAVKLCTNKILQLLTGGAG